MARILKLIYTKESEGIGTESNPNRWVQRLCTEEGLLVAQYDPAGECFMRTLQNVVD